MTEYALTDADGTVRWRGTIDPAPGGGSLPTGWTADSPGPGQLSLGVPGSSSIGLSGLLNRPNGTVAVAFDGDGRVEMYYADGESLGFAISAAEDSTAIEFRKTGAGDSTPILKWDDTAKKWVCNGDFEYTGNNPLLINGGGIDMGEYDVTNFHKLVPHTVPELPAIPTPQDIADALVALGLVTQAA